MGRLLIVDREGEDQRTEPAADVGGDLGAVGRELRSLGATHPLWSAALTAQMRRSLDALASRTLPSAELTLAFDQLARQMVSIPAFNASGLLASIQESFGSARFGEVPRFDFTPAFRALTRAATYSSPDPPKSFYSEAMTSPGAYFANDEARIDSFEGLTSAISSLISKTPQLRLVWRGHRDAEWGIHSALFRRLMEVNDVRRPQARPKVKQSYPDEEQMIRAESEILRVARTDWRFDGLSALETFARIQHAGGPTRLLDVTKNPFIGAWFAVEASPDVDETDGRLIAFATTPVLGPDDDGPRVDTRIELDEEWGDRTPPWHRWDDTIARQAVDWGTGARRRLWVPPAYDPRILSQNAAFLIDGVPITSHNTQSYFRSSSREEPATYWTRADLLAASSIYAKTFKPGRKPRSNQHNFAPTFTFRIEAQAKAEIREYLVSRFGYTHSYIYPDVAALADFVANMEMPRLGP